MSSSVIYIEKPIYITHVLLDDFNMPVDQCIGHAFVPARSYRLVTWDESTVAASEANYKRLYTVPDADTFALSASTLLWSDKLYLEPDYLDMLLRDPYADWGSSLWLYSKAYAEKHVEAFYKHPLTEVRIPQHSSSYVRAADFSFIYSDFLDL